METITNIGQSAETVKLVFILCFLLGISTLAVIYLIRYHHLTCNRPNSSCAYSEEGSKLQTRRLKDTTRGEVITYSPRFNRMAEAENLLGSRHDLKVRGTIL
jgi:hypothetical protein